MKSRLFARIGIAGAIASLGLVVSVPGVASAHVTIAETEQVAGAYTVLTFGLPHGCSGSPTTEVRIQIPEEIPQVTPTINLGWDVEKVMEELDEPIEGGHGVELTERVAEVVYTAQTPLPEGFRDAFELSIQNPELPGQTLYFPTIQTCEEGEHAWVELPSDTVPAEELEEPAPRIELVTAEGAGDAGDGGDEAATVTGDEAAQSPIADAADDGSGSSNVLAVIALIVGVVGVALGGTALMASRRTA